MNEITIYTTPTCGFCHMAKQYFTKLGLPYNEIDITSNGEGFKWVVDHTGRSAVPVIRIADATIVGFDRPEIDTALKTAKLV